MEENKNKFVPNIPASRPVRETAPPTRQKERTPRKRVPKKTIDAAEAVASGPFALGPAKRSVKTSRSEAGFGGASVKVKLEALDQERQYIGSDEEKEELDLDFDINDPNIPCNISRFILDDDDQIKVDDQDDLVLIQVPDILTSIISSSSYLASAQSDNTPVKQEDVHSITDSKNGRIGSLFIHPDGRLELKISNLSFDLSRAPNSHSLQKLVSVDGKKATDLGRVSQRMICTPQID